GNVYTPDGVYNIETVDGQTVVVNLEQSGLESAGYEHDQADFVNAGYYATNTAKAGNTTASSGSASATTTSATTATGTVVDLMVLYTTVNQTADYAKQRIKYLVDVSNQAYKDSGINMSLRLVHARATSYVENNDNSQALDDLANDRGAFAGTAALRNQYGADLVALFRPLYAKTAGSCGTAYVGFVNGSGADPSSGYGAIGDGYSKDALSNYYCGTNTFAHEIGHNFGNVHDREYSNDEGKFPYSYAWGISNKFGTIMSYYGPSLMLFSTPALATQCAGTPCGFPEGDANASDQTRTINYTAPFVSGYRATTVGAPVIQ
ncbi:MAG: M12 family metallo-peptidase, partial [Methylococcaceae bacterium]|nr:M12 family metallo-peptidase [Methylococcaceae bacterium]